MKIFRVVTPFLWEVGGNSALLSNWAEDDKTISFDVDIEIPWDGNIARVYKMFRQLHENDLLIYEDEFNVQATPFLMKAHGFSISDFLITFKHN